MDLHNCVPETTLPILHFRGEFLPTSSLPTDYYLGSAWRGALGYALKATSPALFQELYAEEGDGGRQHALVLSPVVNHATESGGILLDIILCGKLTAHYQTLLAALLLAAENGLYSVPLNAFSLQQFHPEIGWRICDPDEQQGMSGFSVADAPPAPEKIVIHLLHPLRIKGPKGILKPGDFSLDELLTRILRRHHNLIFDWRGKGLSDWHHLKSETARVMATANQLSWHDWRRYSHRQEQHIPMGGLLGHLIAEGSGLEMLWPYLWAGQWLHVGKGTMMGLGQYALEAVN